MKHFCSLLIAIFLFMQPGYALFRAVPQAKVAPLEQRIAAAPHLTEHDKSVMQRAGLGGTGQSLYDRLNSSNEGSIAFVCALLAVVCLAAALITSFQLLLLPVFIFGTIAAVTGAIGVKRLKRGFAIAGVALGLLAIVGGFVASALME